MTVPTMPFRRWRSAIVLSSAIVLFGCKNDAQRYLSVDDARIERGDGIALGGAEIGHSVLVAGTFTNRHPSKTAINVHLEVKLFRKAGDDKPTRTYDEYLIKGLERVGPGQNASFHHYVKTSLAGYERCEIRPLSSDFI